MSEYAIDDCGFYHGDYRYRVVRVHEDGLREGLVTNLTRRQAERHVRDLEENFS